MGPGPGRCRTYGRCAVASRLGRRQKIRQKHPARQHDAGPPRSPPTGALRASRPASMVRGRTCVCPSALVYTTFVRLHTCMLLPAYRHGNCTGMRWSSTICTMQSPPTPSCCCCLKAIVARHTRRLHGTHQTHRIVRNAAYARWHRPADAACCSVLVRLSCTCPLVSAHAHAHRTRTCNPCRWHTQTRHNHRGTATLVYRARGLDIILVAIVTALEQLLHLTLRQDLKGTGPRNM